MWRKYAFLNLHRLTVGTRFPLVLARWFLGLTDMRWRAAELFNLAMKPAGLLKSTPAVGVAEAEAGEVIGWGDSLETGDRGLDDGWKGSP